MVIAGRTALVTGATGGIGQAIARTLHRAGAELVITGRRTDVLEPLAGDLGGSVRVLACDLADRDAVDRLADACAGVDILVANAALPGSGDLLTLDPATIDRTLEVNLRAPIILARALGAAMADRGAGQLVFISSLAGKTATPGASVYAATKFGLRGFGRGLRADLAPRGVGVSVVFPGFVREAGMFHDSGATLPGFVGTSSPEDVADGVRDAIERDRGEVDVAPATVRAGTKLSEIAPGLADRLTLRLGGRELAGEVAAGQVDKR
jgi:short-subunit dehydrogenase